MDEIADDIFELLQVWEIEMGLLNSNVRVQC